MAGRMVARGLRAGLTTTGLVLVQALARTFREFFRC